MYTLDLSDGTCKQESYIYKIGDTLSSLILFGLQKVLNLFLLFHQLVQYLLQALYIFLSQHIVSLQ